MADMGPGVISYTEHKILQDTEPGCQGRAREGMKLKVIPTVSELELSLQNNK